MLINEATELKPANINQLVSLQLLEGIVNSAIVEHVSASKLISPGRHRFCLSQSIDSYLIDTYEHVTKPMDIWSPVEMVLLGLPATFDKICRREIKF